MSIIDRLRKKWVDSPTGQHTSDVGGITVGYVIDTNDPQQMGRVRALCPALGDSTSSGDYKMEEIPWAYYCSPFAGFLGENASKGPTDDVSREDDGPLAYGMWSPPRVGAQVLIMCIDDDPQHRVYLGCMFLQHSPHIMPHGRYSYNIPNRNSASLDGPFSSTEKPIQPLYDNLTKAFTSDSPLSNNGRDSIEWLSRGADYSVSAIDNQNITNSFSGVADDKTVSVTLSDGIKFTKRQGYAYDRINKQAAVESTGVKYDNTVFSWSTPGFHAMSMDDRPENCRMRFRTTTGHQIILDDTNERIYISTAEGKNWIEMDQKGNVDIYAENKISIHSDSDINIDSSENIRMSAKNIHLNASEEIRFSSGSDFHIKTDSVFRVKNNSTFVETSDFNVKASNVNLDATTNGSFVGNIVGQASYALTAESCTLAASLGGPGATAITNGPPSVNPSESITANLTTRKPLHEPWPRISYNLNLTDVSDSGSIPQQALEHGVNSIKVNIEDHGTVFDRNPYWIR